MRKSIYSVLLVLFAVQFCVCDAVAQVRVSRSEFLCYDRREDANRDVRTAIDKYIVIAPAEQFRADEGKVRAVYEQTFEVPATWQDYNAYLHMENVGGDYTIFFNGRQITAPIDRYTPVDLFVSPYLVQGENVFAVVVVEEESMRLLDEDLKIAERKQFENCYLFAQRKLGIYDYNVHLRPDSLGRFAELKLDIIADNSFSTNEVINVGYDIYSPEGKLVEYSVNDVAMEGFTRDTVRYSPYIYNSNPNRWSPKNPKLYDLMLYVKLNGILREYIPLKVGFVDYGYTDDGAITAFGEPLTLNKATYNSASDRATTEKEIKALKAKGINCLCPDYPQPRWFYDICDRVGIYVIDCVAISSPTNADNRDINGTPANAPWLMDEYVARALAMYYRSRHHACIIAFSLSNCDSGNGYNMYKAYEALKALGDSRAMIYPYADGEWNSDI
jgi:beta-galactosidase